jgi:subtilisin family serine protease
MTSSAAPHRKLDPRLRALAGKIGDPARLADEVSNARVQVDADAPQAAESMTTRVLVKITGVDPAPATGPELAAAVPGSTWTEVVDGIYAVQVPVTALGALAAHPQVQFVEAGRRLWPQLVTSLPATHADELHSPAPALTALTDRPLTGKGVVVGIVDYGLDFTLDDFRNADGTTRLAFLWDQGLQPLDDERSPAGFGFGVEYDADAINGALKSADPFEVVRHKPAAGSHGTHVTGIAAGNGRSADAAFPAGKYVGAAPEATVVFVQPNTAGEAGSFTDSPNVALAIAYVYRKAAELGLPCVINMSLSQNGGSHDGLSLVEQAIDRLLEQAAGRAFVHAAGNGHVWRNHASAALAAGEVRTLHWKVGGGLPTPSGAELPAGADTTLNELEIWYSPRDELHVRLVHPSGEATALVRPGQQADHRFADGTHAVLASERFSLLNGDAQVYVAVERGAAEAVTSGTWLVEITAAGVRDGRLHAWVERDVRDPAFRQSFFLGTDFDPIMTLGTPATTRLGIGVANYNHQTLGLSASSSRGRTRDGRDKPEVAAPGTLIVSSNALGGRPDEAGEPLPVRIAMSGTSMSAPHVTGIAAQLLQHDPRLSAAQLRKALLASANPAPGVAAFDNGWGFGRVDAVAALRLLTT